MGRVTFVRICRVAVGDELHYGVIEADAVALLSSHPFGPFEPDGRVLPLAEVRLVAPVLPSKIVAVGKNYLAHVQEMGGQAPPSEPMIFLKPSTSVIGPGEPILLPLLQAEAARMREAGERGCLVCPHKVPIED